MYLVPGGVLSPGGYLVPGGVLNPGGYLVPGGVLNPVGGVLSPRDSGLGGLGGLVWGGLVWGGLVQGDLPPKKNFFHFFFYASYWNSFLLFNVIVCSSLAANFVMTL